MTHVKTLREIVYFKCLLLIIIREFYSVGTNILKKNVNNYHLNRTSQCGNLKLISLMDLAESVVIRQVFIKGWAAEIFAISAILSGLIMFSSATLFSASVGNQDRYCLHQAEILAHHRNICNRVNVHVLLVSSKKHRECIVFFIYQQLINRQCLLTQEIR